MVNEEEKIQILHFQTQHVHLCIDVNFIKKLFPLLLLESIPNSAHYVAGLMNIAGHSIPVIDFSLYLELQRDQNYSLNATIIMLSNGYDEIGLIVDHVVGLANIEKSALKMQDKFNDAQSPFSATGILGTDQILLVDTTKLFKVNLMKSNPNFITTQELSNKMMGNP